jgi:predicted transcriptional regulator
LKLNRTLFGFFLILVIAISFAALIQRQKNAAFSAAASRSTSPLAIFDSTTCNLLTSPTFTQHFLTTSNLEVNVAERPVSVFTNSTRVAIYDFIKANPGFQFRGICSQLGISIGVAEFHLGVLKKAGLISFFRDGRYKRFFESKKFSQKEMATISLLRHDTTKSIIKTMLEEKRVSHGELACQLSITSQGLTWQVNRLKKEGVIQESKEGMKVLYSLEQAYVPMIARLVNLVEQA